MAAKAPAKETWEGLFSGALGLWLGLALLKFGNPVILDGRVAVPASWDELVHQSWPVAWGHWLLLGVVLLAVPTAMASFRKCASIPSPLTPSLSPLRGVGQASSLTWTGKMPVLPVRWLALLPLGWMGWQCVSAIRTIDESLTAATLKHFGACLVCFYAGLFALGRVRRMAPFWLGLCGGFAVVLAVGWEQHFGGLERTRKFFYALPDWQRYPPEFLKKIASDRIFSTLVYPNALAGVILLLLPVTVAQLWGWSVAGGHSPVRRAMVVAGPTAAALGCLVWSGSKAGWLIAMGQGMLALLRSTWPRKLKVVAVAATLLIGLTAFGLRYAGYFRSGASSATARVDYWRAAWATLLRQPITGTGPGTFMIAYRAIKQPEAEMTRLAHNDYLQQGSDSGLLGLLFYFGFWAGSLVILYRDSSIGGARSGLWIGLVGFAVQSGVEFGLYVPALAWPAFCLLGLGLSGCGNRSTTP